MIPSQPSGARRLAPALALLLFGVGACGDHPLEVTPPSGGQGGGDRIRIAGDDFVGHGAPVVYVGERAAKAVVIESRWLVTAITPQTEDPRTVEVRLVFEDGTVVEIPDAFTYREQEGIILQPEIGGGGAPLSPRSTG